MRITKNHLRKIVKEELQNILMKEEASVDPRAAVELAKALSKDTAIMDAVKKAAAEPEIQEAALAVAQEAQAEEGLEEEVTPTDVAMVDTLGFGGLGMAGLGIVLANPGSMAGQAALAALAASPAMGAAIGVGIAGAGVLSIALATLVAAEALSR
jgi:hypothetical protein